MRRRNGPHLIRFQKGDDGPRHLNKNSTYMAIHLHSLERELFVTLAFRLRCSLARAEGTAAEEATGECALARPSTGSLSGRLGVGFACGGARCATHKKKPAGLLV